MAVAFDWSTANLPVAVVKAAGVEGGIRYLSIPGFDQSRWKFNEDKRIKKPEYDTFRALNFPISLVMQVDKNDWQFGYNHGVDHGRASLAQSRALGHPDSCGVALAVQDQGIPTSGIPTAVEYMHGYIDGRGLGRQPCYGGTLVGEACIKAGYASWIWQAASSSWSPIPSSNVAIKQLTSKSYPQFPQSAYDENLILKSDWGQNPGPQIPTTPPEEEIMAFIAFSDKGSPLCVAADCSNYFFLSANDYSALVGAGYKVVKLDQETLDRIPYTGTLQAKMDALIAAVLNIDTSVEFSLTPEQIQKIADSITIPQPDLQAIAEAAAEELKQRLES